jgi:hypothetical protein
MASYNLYRTDGVRVKINSAPITHPNTQFDFLLTVPDGSQMVLKFVLTAVDQAGNESLDSNTATYPFDQLPPGAPGSLGVGKKPNP